LKLAGFVLYGKMKELLYIKTFNMLLLHVTGIIHAIKALYCLLSCAL